MKAPKITKGHSWRAKLNCRRVGWWRHEIVLGKGNQVIAEVVPLPRFASSEEMESEESTAEGLANAKAIAALPDLLAALARTLSVIETHGTWDEGCFYYAGKSASELQAPIAQVRAALLAAGYTEA